MSVLVVLAALLPLSIRFMSPDVVAALVVGGLVTVVCVTPLLALVGLVVGAVLISSQINRQRYRTLGRLIGEEVVRAQRSHGNQGR